MTTSEAVRSEMKYHHILGFLADWIGQFEIEELTRIKPEARSRSGFGYKLTTSDPTGDEFIRRSLEILQLHQVPRRMIANTTSYGYYIARSYEPDDLKNAEFLVMIRHSRIHNCLKPARDNQGRIFLMATKAKKSLKLGCLFYPDWVIVSNQVRQSFENAGLVGLRFGEVAIKGHSIHLSPEPFWELQSSITLPKMSNVRKLIHPESVGHPTVEPFQGDYSRTVYINDEPFRPGEVHYRRSDLETFGQFDIAATFENYMDPHPALVVSQRFYQHCLKHKIPLAVEPVRIDPD